MFEHKYVSEGENNKHRKSDLDIGPLRKDSRPTWVNTAVRVITSRWKSCKEWKRVSWQRKLCCR